MSNSEKYALKISRKTVDQLGIKLYDKVPAAIAEIIANSYDADAEKITISIPLNKWLAAISEGELVDRGYEIVIEDDGHGFNAEEANELYLVVGKERRKDPRQGPFSRVKRRPVMGRKGIGKLSPFGICNEIEVWSAGGERTDRGYEITNFIIRYSDMIGFETETEYHPTPGESDGEYAEETGTKITLRNFNRRRTPNAVTFHRQLARRFSIGLPDFQIWINDTTGSVKPFKLGSFEVEIMDGTKVAVDERAVIVYVEDQEGNRTEEVEETLPVSGWVAFSKNPYRDEEMAGVRIYTRGKLATVTRDFGIRSGFTGENTIRSYLVGEIHAEWIDPDSGEDMNRTDRQDILWNTKRGQAFQEWGRQRLRDLGRISRTPVQEKAWYQFLEKTDFKNRAYAKLRGEQTLVERAMVLGKLIGGRVGPDELDDPEKLGEMADVIVSCAPQFEWIDTMAKMGSIESISLGTIAELFAKAKIGELTVLGRVALQRLTAIDRLKKEIDREIAVEERILQSIIEQAPWLINPQWTVFGRTETFKSVRERFERWYEHKYGKQIKTSTLQDDAKKADFVLLNPGKRLEIVEIKKRWHRFTNAENERLNGYIEALDTFLVENEDYRKEFGDECHATLVCDEIGLSGANERAFTSLVQGGRLENISWDVFLTRAGDAHQDFIDALEKDAR